MHAYLIMAHNQFELLERLIRCLDDERNDIYVHIDAKVRDFDFARFEKLTERSRLIFTRRIKNTWGDFSIVRCELLLLSTALENEREDRPYTYFHLLSGVDLPLRSNDALHEFFCANAGKEFVHYSGGSPDPSSLNRVRYYHFFRGRRNLFFKVAANAVLKLEKALGVNRLKNSDVKFQKGCNWFSITRPLAQHLVERREQIEKLFRFTYCSDEMFVQTMVESSDFCANLFMPDCGDDHMACARFIDWQRGKPYVFRLGDYDALMSSGCMFARKFSLEVDREIVDKIIQAVHGG